MTIDLVNIWDKNCPLRTLEMAFQRIKSSKFSVGECPQTLPGAHPFSAGLIKKIFLLTQKVDQCAFSAYRPNYGGREIIWPNLEICGQILILLLFE